ncbi:TPA: hypothetical protein ACH3X3_008225 [Trebouxia sp. C0006]
MPSHDFSTTPADLPRPTDDGACAHLQSCSVPSIELGTTDGSWVNLAQLDGLCILFCYPMTGRPGVPLPPHWDAIPGARGCTPQACSYRDRHIELKQHVSYVFGLSTQTSPYQKEAAQRLHLPYPLLSDSELKLAKSLALPTFHVDGVGELIKRLTLIIKDGRIVHCIYPVFPSDGDVPHVLEWLRLHA